MKTARIEIRCSEKEKKEIARLARRAKMSVSRFVVKVAIEQGYDI